MIDGWWIAAQVLAGALGAVTRFGVMTLVRPRSWPWGLFTVNAVGSVLVGAAVGVFSGQGIPWTTAALVLAFSAGLTTFSTLTVEAAGLIEKHENRAATVLLSVHVGGGVALALAGYILASGLVGAW